MFNVKRCLCIAVAVTALGLSACADRTIGANAPVTATMENITIDWDQVRDDIEEVMNDNPDFPHGKYVDFAVYEDRKIIRLIWPLDDEITQIESLDYGKALIKNFNDVVAMQDFSIAKSSDTSYGGLWDRYNLELELYNEIDIMEPDLYYVNQYMEAGSNDPVIPEIRSDVAAESTESAESTEESADGQSTAAE